MSAFIAEEKNFLMFLIEQYKNVIENKKTDANSNRAKAEAWHKICVSFNSRFSKRTEKQLRKLWDNMKSKTRKLDTEYKINMLKTGGGPPPQEHEDVIAERVRSIVPTINFEVDNVFDSNSNIVPQPETCNQTIKAINELPESQNNLVMEDTNIQENKENIRKPRKIRKVAVRKTKLPSRDQLSRLIDCEARLRVQKVKEAIQQQEQLHKTRMAVLAAEQKYWETKR
ncbi:hypothetical protein ABEB36_000374 [Hypothenemus hampei]|uniref:Regulatory protein zeste n=1 Tax=Hypothenemus hampei TaxID=57062 RepID=A0ABD1FB09_HYPHA